MDIEAEIQAYRILKLLEWYEEQKEKDGEAKPNPQ